MKTSILKSLIVITATLASTGVYAAKTPKPLATDSRVKHVMYSPNQVYEITGTYGYQTSLEFAPDEKIKVVSLGDTIAWQTKPYENRVFIKPVEARARTNMTIITNKRTYYFMLKSKKSSTDATFLVRFKYPTPPTEELVQSNSADKSISGFDPDQINLDYSISGQTHAIPVERILDDGQFTFFRFPHNSEIPSIYNVEPDGTESIVNTRREGAYVVVERTGRKFTLRNGKAYLCIKNNQQPKAQPQTIAGEI